MAEGILALVRVPMTNLNTMTSKIHSPYKEERPAAQSVSLFLSSSIKLGLMILLALLGCLSLSASTGVISRRKSLQRHAEKNASSSRNIAAAPDYDGDNDDDDDAQITEYSSLNDDYLLDEKMRRLLQERNQVGAKRGKVAWLMRCVLTLDRFLGVRSHRTSPNTYFILLSV